MNNVTFQWNDALVKEYLQTRLGDTYKDLEHFKQSKTAKKEYEVVQIVNSKGGTIYKDRDDVSWEQYCSLRSFEGFTIKKVKRLSDGEVFSVGDYVKWAHRDPFNITGFKIGLKDAMYCLDSEELPYYLTEVKKCLPQHKKEWEIVEIRVNYLSESNISFVREVDFFHPVNSKSGVMVSRTESELLEWGGKIYVVRRLPDGELFLIGGINEYPTGLQETIKEFKVSEETPTMMLFRTCNEIWQNISIAKKAQPKKERIEVKDVGIESILIKFEGRRLSVGKIEQVKVAIEKIINND